MTFQNVVICIVFKPLILLRYRKSQLQTNYNSCLPHTVPASELLAVKPYKRPTFVDLSHRTHWSCRLNLQNCHPVIQKYTQICKKP